MSTISLDDPQAVERLKLLLGTNEQIFVTDGSVVAEVKRVARKPVEINRAPRVPGRWAHLNIKVPDDFNDELPDSFWLGEEK
jgi:hypothetical protein